MAKLTEIDYEPGPFNDGLPDATAARGASAPAPASKLVPVDYEPEPYEGGLPPPKKGVVLPSIKRASGQMVESLGTTIEDVTGPNAVTRGLRDFGGGVVRANPSEINSFGDVLDKPWTTVKEAVAEQLPQLGAAYAGAAGGAALGGLLGPAGAAVGGVIGGLAPIAIQEYGEIRGNQKETGEEDIPKALLGAAGATALERFGLEKLATKAGVKGFREAVTALPQGASRLKHAAKEGIKTALVEGPGTEIPQTAIERFAGGQDLASPEAFEDYAVSGVKGAVGGGAIGGGLGVVAPREQAPPIPLPAAATGPGAEPQADASATPGAASPPSEEGLDVGLADLDPEQRRHMMAIRGQGSLTAAAAADGPSSTPASATARATPASGPPARPGSIEEEIARIENSGRDLRRAQDERATVQIAQQGYVSFRSRKAAGEFQLLHPDYKWQKYANNEIRFFAPEPSAPAAGPAPEAPTPLPSRRSRGSLSPLGAEQAERARADIAAEQVRTAELARSGPLGRAVARGAESGSLPGAVTFAAPPSMATPTATGIGPPGASAVARPATPPEASALTAHESPPALPRSEQGRRSPVPAGRHRCARATWPQRSPHRGRGAQARYRPGYALPR